MIVPMHILLQGGFDEGFVQPHFWAIVSTLVILAAATIFALHLLFKWLRKRPRPVERAPRGFAVNIKEENSD